MLGARPNLGSREKVLPEVRRQERRKRTHPAIRFATMPSHMLGRLPSVRASRGMTRAPNKGAAAPTTTRNRYSTAVEDPHPSPAGGPTLAGFCLSNYSKQHLSGRRPGEAKLLSLCLPIGRRFRLLSVCVENRCTFFSTEAAKEGRPPGGCCSFLPPLDGVSCVSKRGRVIRKIREGDPT